jgi:hypothetical protein
MYHDPTGFSVAAPTGWRISREDGILYFRDGTHVLGIDQSPTPQWDPVADWTRQERVRVNAGDFPRYQRIRLEKVNYYLACADWEFTHDSRGGRTHVINRGFVTSDHQAYGIWWSTPDSRWAADFKFFDVVTRTFQPKP